MSQTPESPPAESPESDGPSGLLPDGISPELLHDPFGQEVLDVSRADFEALLDAHQTARGDIREGQSVKARVLRTTEATVILEFGFKSEGAVSRDEFKDTESVEPGQEVEVLLESLEDDDGVVVLSKKKADFLRIWELIRDAYDNDRPVKGLLSRKIKGGVTVDIMGVDAFLPGSQIALRRVPNIEDLIGETYEFKIIKLNKRRRNIVVSRRILLERERKEQRSSLVKELLVGQVREGVVKNITDFGAFIDLGGMDGLLHITDMSWGRVGHPTELVGIADVMDVKVLDIDWDRERLSLGLKQLMPYPWTDIAERYPVGARVRGKVVSITNYGAFVELQKGVEGLVHISEMSWTRNVRHPSKLVSIGDVIETVILKVDSKEEKISLGMKQIEEDPWLGLPSKYPSGAKLTGTVRNLTSFGAFVEIEPGIDGLVHVSDMSWTKRVEHPSEMVRKGDEAEVMVLDVDADNKRISLGIKQLRDDPWPALVARLSRGHEQDGVVVRLQDSGVVVDLGDDVEGFVPGSHAGVDADALEDYYRAGESVPVRVMASDAMERRIVLEVLKPPKRQRKQTPVEDAPAAADGEPAADDEPAEGQAGAEGQTPADGEPSAEGQAPEQEQPPAEGEPPEGDASAAEESKAGEPEEESKAGKPEAEAAAASGEATTSSEADAEEASPEAGKESASEQESAGMQESAGKEASSEDPEASPEDDEGSAGEEASAEDQKASPEDAETPATKS